MAAGGLEGRVGSGSRDEGEKGSRGKGGERGGCVEGDNRDEKNRDRVTEDGSLIEGGGAGTSGLPGWAAGREVYLVGVGTDPQGGQGLTQYQPSGGGVEGGENDSQPLLHQLHFLPRRPPWFWVGLQHRYHFPQGQTASAVKSHDV